MRPAEDQRPPANTAGAARNREVEPQVWFVDRASIAEPKPLHRSEPIGPRPAPAGAKDARERLARRPAASSGRFRARLFAGTVLAVLISACLFLVWCHQRSIYLGYRLERERRTRGELLAERRSLEAEISALRAPARIEKIARDELGMRLPSPAEIVTLDPPVPPPVPAGPAPRDAP